MSQVIQRPLMTDSSARPVGRLFTQAMFDRLSVEWRDMPDVANAKIESPLRGSFRKGTRISALPDFDFDVFFAIQESATQISAKDYFRALAERLCQEHPAISMDADILGGAPHINGLRVSVANVLTHLYHLGSIDAIVNEFKQRISREQVKEALAYAHDFMEMACDPPEAVG